MVGPELFYIRSISVEKKHFLHEVAPRSVSYGHNFIGEPERSLTYVYGINI